MNLNGFNKSKQVIGIFTDAHGLYEPTFAVLNDMKKRGITKIYSLGDNISVGPNPREVLDLLMENNVCSLAGNSEEYVLLGLAPFACYFDNAKVKSYEWTLGQLSDEQIKHLAYFSHSIDLDIGGKKIGLCHFANDVRFDFRQRGSFSYQNRLKNKMPGYLQFLYTNSEEQLQEIEFSMRNNINDGSLNGYISAYNDPLFEGNLVTSYDAIIEGHVHWKLYESSPTTEFYTIRSVGMAYGAARRDLASYIILTEEDNNFKVEEILVPYDRKRMEYSIINSNSPDESVYKYTDLKRVLKKKN